MLPTGSSIEITWLNLFQWFLLGISLKYEVTYMYTAHDLFPFLTAVNCGTLTIPANGQVSHTGGTTFGQTATYSCSIGYNLVGCNIRSCQATRAWSGSAPICQGMLF